MAKIGPKLNTEIVKLTVRGNKVYFNEAGTEMLRKAARRAHKTPQQVFTAAMWRYIRAKEREDREKGLES